MQRRFTAIRAGEQNLLTLEHIGQRRWNQVTDTIRIIQRTQRRFGEQWTAQAIEHATDLHFDIFLRQHKLCAGAGFTGDA